MFAWLVTCCASCLSMPKTVMWEVTPSSQQACQIGVIFKHEWAWIKQQIHLIRPQASRESSKLYRAKKTKAIVE